MRRFVSSAKVNARYKTCICNMLSSLAEDTAERIQEKIMADGSEEREEARKRRELEEREDRQDRLDRLERERRDEGEPERGGS
jgi:hypothetical protein